MSPSFRPHNHHNHLRPQATPREEGVQPRGMKKVCLCLLVQRGGSLVVEARRRKETRYPELLEADRCRLVVFACEVGGRWSAEAVEFIYLLAIARARSAPLPSRLAGRSQQPSSYNPRTWPVASTSHVSKRRTLRN